MIIHFILLGVKNADENELRSIASDPDEIHMYNVADFSFLLDIVDSLTDNLCNSVKGPGMLSVKQTTYISACSMSRRHQQGAVELEEQTFDILQIPDPFLQALL